MRKITFLSLMASAVMLIFIGCEKEVEPEKTKITLNSQSVKIHYDETFALEANVTPEPLDVLWVTDNENVADINQEGIISGVKIGETTITAKTIEAEVICAVTVEPYESFVTEPLVDFGENKDYVKDNENRVLYNETADGLVYEDNSNSLVDYVFYMFENNILDGSVIMLNQSVVNLETERLMTFFDERYYYVGSQDGIIMYENDTVGVGISVIQGVMVVLYVENNSNKSVTGLVTIYRKKVDNIVHRHGLLP